MCIKYSCSQNITSKCTKNSRLYNEYSEFSIIQRKSGEEKEGEKKEDGKG